MSSCLLWTNSNTHYRSFSVISDMSVFCNLCSYVEKKTNNKLIQWRLIWASATASRQTADVIKYMYCLKTDISSIVKLYFSADPRQYISFPFMNLLALALNWKCASWNLLYEVIRTRTCQWIPLQKSIFANLFAFIIF